MGKDEKDIPADDHFEDLDWAEEQRAIHLAFLNRADWGEGLPLRLSELYSSKAEIEADARGSVTTRMKGRVKEAVLAAADRADMDAAEFLRRGLWLIMRFPSLIELTDADEEDFRKTLGSSRWHKDTSDKEFEI